MPTQREVKNVEIQRLAEAIQDIGFECTDCGDCCTSDAEKEANENVVTVFPDDIERITEENDLERDEVAEPMPLYHESGVDETFEWALKRTGCGDCIFYEGQETDGTDNNCCGEKQKEGDSDEMNAESSNGVGGDTDSAERDTEVDGGCSIYGERPWICRTYPFDLEFSSEPSFSQTDHEVRRRDIGEVSLLVYECEGVGQDMAWEKAVEYARRLKKRKLDEVHEEEKLLQNYEPTEPPEDHVAVHDSRGTHLVEK